MCIRHYKKLCLGRLLFYSISYFLKHRKFSVYGQYLSGLQEQEKRLSKYRTTQTRERSQFQKFDNTCTKTNGTKLDKQITSFTN